MPQALALSPRGLRRGGTLREPFLRWLRTGIAEDGLATAADLAAFRAHTDTNARPLLGLMTALLTVFNVGFWFTDAWVFRTLPGAAETLAQARLWLVGVALVVGIGLKLPRVPVYPLGMLGGLAVSFITARSLGDLGGPSAPWFHFLHAYLLAPALAIFLPARRLVFTLTVAAACLLGYFGPHPEYLRDPYAATSLAHFSYVATLSVAVGWYADSLRLRYFLSQRTLTAEREALAARVAEATRALRRLARHRDEVQDAERTRVARELHDELGQGLTALRMVLKTSRDRHARDPAAIAPNLEQLAELLHQLTDDTRRLVSDMRPRVLDDLGLAPALDWLAARATERGIPCTVTCSADLSALPPAVANAAFRCAQEALTNVAKHAGASAATVTAGVHEGALELTVQDDGVGFDPATVRDGAFGLVGMRERALALGGSVEVEPNAPRGTTLRVRLPIAEVVA
jgi:signal transduction histidine kinase